MIELTVLLLLAALGYGIAQKFRMPVIPFLLVLGLLFSLTGLIQDTQSAQFLVELGLIVLVFTAGIELSPKRFTRQSKQASWVAVGQFSLVGFFAVLLAQWLGHDPMSGLYLGLATAASSTLVVIRQLKSKQQMFQPFGRLVTGVLLIQDFILIAIIVILTKNEGGPVAIASGVLGLFALAAVAAVAHWFLLPWLQRTLKPDEEILLLLGLAVLFAFIGGARALDIPLVTGAFFAGFSLSVFPINGLMRGLMSSLNEFFSALFFTALGSLVVFSSAWILPQAFAFALLVIIVTPPIVTILAEWQGQSARNAVESGLMLAQTSELSLVLGLVGVSSGHLTIETFSVIVLTCAITMMLTPVLATDRVTWKLLHWHPGRQGNEGFAGYENHVVMIGFGKSGMWVVRDLRAAGHKILAIDDDASVIAELEREKIACMRGDGTDPKLLRKAGITDAKVIVVTLPRPTDVVKIIQTAPGVPVIARIFEEQDAEIVRKAGGIPVMSSEAALENFLNWYQNRPGKI